MYWKGMINFMLYLKQTLKDPLRLLIKGEENYKLNVYIFIAYF